ncbi:CRISPR-associated exonuclease Cas4 [Cetobacterium ceti]|uniref:CRISPR-associated exonuclease Cas4 n=1 Tax=Cetobacterium ceti TaxID=180163 RepID=A0A1T4MAB9_9FUSO|nr:CRISPR-associated exonuclease Cas4 [Cetobacterium ceti]
MEDENENVQLGKLIDEHTYQDKNKHIMIDNTINIDFVDKWKVIHEVKKDKTMEDASIWQIKYYLYFLKKKGIKVEKGILDYPKLRKLEEIFLEKEDEDFIENSLEEIRGILKKEYPPKQKKLPICKNCAYFEYCFV